MNGQIHGRIYGWMDLMYRWMDGLTDLMDGRMDGWMDGLEWDTGCCQNVGDDTCFVIAQMVLLRP